MNARPGWSVAYSVGFDLDERVRTAIAALPEQAWEAALDAAGAAREDAQVAEVTGLLRHSTGGDRLDTWPAGMRIMVRREQIETGAQLSLFEQINGYRYQVLATASLGGQVQRLEARHRVHARVEGFIRCGKATGLAKWPSSSFAINTAWVIAAAIAIDLLCWTRLLLLDGPLAKAEPATLRYRLLHTAARLVNHSRIADPTDIPKHGPGHNNSPTRSTASWRSPDPPASVRTTPGRSNRHRDRGTRRHRTTRGDAAYPPPQNHDRNGQLRARHGPTRATVKYQGKSSPKRRFFGR